MIIRKVEVEFPEVVVRVREYCLEVCKREVGESEVKKCVKRCINDFLKDM